jgi:hypothetical protein
MFTDWDGLLDDCTYTIGCLEDREFLIMEVLVGLDPNPYAQVAREGDGSYYCEVVSTHHLPASVWPADEWPLVAAGWESPVGRQTRLVPLCGVRCRGGEAADRCPSVRPRMWRPRCLRRDDRQVAAAAAGWW